MEKGGGRKWGEREREKGENVEEKKWEGEREKGGGGERGWEKGESGEGEGRKIPPCTPPFKYMG